MPSTPVPLNPFEIARLQSEAFDRLNRGGQLVIWTVRAIAMGHGDCPALQRLFDTAFGSYAAETFQGFLITVRTLGWCARRKLRLHAPGCLRVSPDEQMVLALFTTAQAALAHGDEAAVQDRLDALVEPAVHAALRSSLQTVASALEVNGYGLGSPELGTTDVAPTARTLH